MYLKYKGDRNILVTIKNLCRGYALDIGTQKYYLIIHGKSDFDSHTQGSVHNVLGRFTNYTRKNSKDEANLKTRYTSTLNITRKIHIT